jgi:hypothetical protein
MSTDKCALHPAGVVEFAVDDVYFAKYFPSWQNAVSVYDAVYHALMTSLLYCYFPHGHVHVVHVHCDECDAEISHS